MSFHKDPANTTKKLLGTAALFFCLALWVDAHRMEGSAIFSERRATELADLNVMFHQLSTGLKQNCMTGTARKVIFDDSDVLLPYVLPTRDTSIGRCELVRETNVTPISEDSLTDCSAIRVIEYTPFMRKVQPLLALEAPPPDRKNWTQLFRWTSSGNNLGFALFQRMGCPTSTDARNTQR